MPKQLLAILILATLILPGCMFFPDKPATVNGSGNVVSETREVSGITSISLEGSADVNVKFGSTESLVISGEDNIIFLIETNVQNHQLIIKTKPRMIYVATKPVVIDVSVTELKGVSISGSGNINVTGLTGDSFTAALPGTGNITLAGSTNDVKISMQGSGNVFADKLIAKNAVVSLSGSGNVTVFASGELDATNSGPGNIRYFGNPTRITKNVTGPGTIEG